MDYKNAGVDIEAGNKAVELMKELLPERCAVKCLLISVDFQERFLWRRSRQWNSLL